MPRSGMWKLRPASLAAAWMLMVAVAAPAGEIRPAVAERPATAERCVPAATCNVPAPDVLSREALPPLPIFLGINLERLRQHNEAGAVLKAWEAAAARLAPLTEGERQRATQLHRARHSGHELALMLEFRGPVDADELAARYEWTCTESPAGHLVLAAVPRETEERLFLPGFEVTLDAETHLPVTMQFADRGSAAPQEIRLVTYQEEERPVAAVETAEPVTLVVAEAPRTDRRAPAMPAQATPIPDTRPADGDLQTILHDWEWAASRVKRVEFRFRRFVYDSVFATEKRAEGHILFEAPNRGRIDMQAAAVADEQSRRVDRSGKPYQLISDSPHIWIWDGKNLTMTNETDATFEVRRIPQRLAGQAAGFLLPASPQEALPFVFGPGPADVRARYRFELLKNSEREVWIQAIPVQRPESARHLKITVILDRQTHFPRAVQMVDPSGNQETVYTFSDILVNQPIAVGENPFRLDATRYRERVSP